MLRLLFSNQRSENIHAAIHTRVSKCTVEIMKFLSSVRQSRNTKNLTRLIGKRNLVIDKWKGNSKQISPMQCYVPFITALWQAEAGES